MESQRYLRCLGQPVLFAATGEPIRFRTRKHLALLVYIAVEARAHRRDRLAELLWPKVSVTEARHSLATALSTLRPRLGPEGLETSRDHARLVPGRVALDLERLQAGDVLGTEVTGPLEVAAFLDGFDITDSAEFTHWKDRQQARLLPMIKDALLVLIDRCRRNGESRQIEQLADRMLALDDLCEEAIRAKMEARAFAGDRLTALEIFEEWKAKLTEELHAVPSDLVEGMAVRLRRRGWERTTLANVPTVPTDQWRGRPFIGRTAEYRQLYDAWEGVRKGVPGHALILGDSGVGKTTLVQRLTTAAGLEGAAISRVQCYDVEREIPYSTLSSLVIGLLDSPGVSATSPEALAELARTVPAVRHRFPNVPLPSEAQGETARIRLTEAFIEMLAAIAEEHPIILVVDDLHLADDVSLAVLHLVMRRASHKPLMVLFLARSGEVSESSQAARLRDSSDAVGMRVIRLLPLNDEDSLHMLETLIPRDEPRPSLGEQRALLLASSGYPMALELLVQDWRNSGEQSLALSVNAMTANIGPAFPTQSYYQVILNRIARAVDGTTQNVLNLASILGHRLNDLSLYAIVDLSVGQTMTSMAELVNRRVLRDGPQGLEFVNEMVRAAAYVSVTPTLRRSLHGSVADLFIRKYGQGSNDLALETAWHCMRAGRTDEATYYLLCGAREAISKGALHSAERALSTALPHLKGPECDQARLLLVEVLQEQGRWLDSIKLLRDRTSHVSDLEVLLSLLADYWSTLQAPSDLLAKISKACDMIASNTDVHLQVKAAAVVAQFQMSLRDVNLAKQLLKCVSDIPTVSLAIHEWASLSDAKARLLYNAFERGPRLKEISEIAKELSDKRYVNSTVASLYNGLGAVACSEGNYSAARIEFRRAYEINVALGNDRLRGHRAANIALCCIRLGEYEQALEWTSIAMNTHRDQFAGYIECQTAQYSGCGNALIGNFAKACAAIDRLESRICNGLPEWITQAWLLAKADILQLVGRHSEALGVGLQALGRERPVLHSPFFAGGYSRWLALTARGTPRENDARVQILSMVDALETFDVLDQVELLCAMTLLDGKNRSTEADLGGLIKAKLGDLPSAIPHQLDRLGVLAQRG